MHKCERCGGGVSWTSDTVKLLGGYIAHLCNACASEWANYINGTKQRAAILDMDAIQLHYESLAVAGRPVALEDWQKLLRDKQRALREVFALAAEFCKPLKAAAVERG